MSKRIPTIAKLIVEISSEFDRKSYRTEMISRDKCESCDFNGAFHALGLSHAYGTLSHRILDLMDSVDDNSSAEDTLNAILELVSNL